MKLLKGTIKSFKI